MALLGTVREIFRYPVKSMGGEAQGAASIGWHGVDGDRRFAFRRIGDASEFPWLSASKLPELVRFRPYFAPDGPSGRVLRVITPEGQDLPGDSRELQQRIATSFGGPVELMQLKHGIFDEAPLSLITTATVRRLSETSGVGFDIRRFRPNIVIETPDGTPFAEDGWVGRSVSCGGRPDSVLISVTMRDLRCVMINFDPDTAESDPRLLKTTAQLNSACSGVYGVSIRTGAISVGDELYALT